MPLNPSQERLVSQASQAQAPFDIGACLSAAWSALTRDLGRNILLNLLGLIIFGIGSGLTFGILAGPLLLGLIRLNQRILRAEQADANVLFSGFSDFGPALGLALVSGILTALGYLLCFLPGLYLAVAWSASWHLLADGRGSFWECMEISRRAITSHWGWALLLLIIAHLIGWVGVLACGVGLLLTLPLAILFFLASLDRLLPRDATL
jgi:uncharacterized membrane protein